MASQWFYKRDGQQHGPFESKALKALAAQGLLRPDDLIWKEGMSKWQPAAKATGLMPSSVDAPPQPFADSAASQMDAVPTTASSPPIAARVAAAMSRTLKETASAAERTKIKTLSLPSAYYELGKWCYAKRQATDTATDVYRNLDKLTAELSQLEAASPEAPQQVSRTFAEQAKSVASKGMAYAQSQVLQQRHKQLLTALGERVHTVGVPGIPEEITARIVQWKTRLIELEGPVGDKPPPKPRRRRLWVWAAAIAGCLLLAGFFAKRPKDEAATGNSTLVSGLTATRSGPPQALVGAITTANTKTSDAIHNSLASVNLVAYDVASSPGSNYLCFLCQPDSQEIDRYNYSRRTHAFLWSLKESSPCVTQKGEQARLTLPAAFSPSDKELACLDGDSLTLWSLSPKEARIAQTITVPSPLSNPAARRGGAGYSWKTWNAVSWRHPDTVLLLWFPERGNHGGVFDLQRKSRGVVTCVVRRVNGKWTADTQTYAGDVVSPDGKYCLGAEETSGSSEPIRLYVKQLPEGGGASTYALPADAVADGVLGLWDHSGIGGDIGTNQPFVKLERLVAFTDDGSRFCILKTLASGRGHAIDVVDSASCQVLHTLDISPVLKSTDDVEDSGTLVGTSGDGQFLLGLTTLVKGSSRGHEAQNTLYSISLLDGQITRNQIQDLDNVFLAHGNEFDGSTHRLTPNSDGSVVWAALTSKPSGMANERCTTCRAFTTNADVVEPVTLSSFVSGAAILITPDGKWIAGLGGRDAKPCVFTYADLVQVRDTLNDSEKAFDQGEYKKALEYCTRALSSEGFSGVVDRREPFVAKCCECLAAMGQLDTAKAVLATLDSSGYRWDPQLEPTKQMVGAVRAEEQARREALAREQSEREEERVRSVRKANQSKRVDTRTITCTGLLTLLDTIKSAGSITGVVTTAIFADFSLVDVCGEPAADEEWIDSKRLWRYRCRDGVVTLTITIGAEGTVVLTGVNVLRL